MASKRLLRILLLPDCRAPHPLATPAARFRQVRLTTCSAEILSDACPGAQPQACVICSAWSASTLAHGAFLSCVVPSRRLCDVAVMERVFELHVPHSGDGRGPAACAADAGHAGPGDTATAGDWRGCARLGQLQRRQRQLERQQLGQQRAELERRRADGRL